MAETRSTCPYCGVGCGVIIESQAEQITGVRGDPDHPANFGRLCTKGRALHLTASSAVTRQTRLLYPMQRAQRHEAAQRVSWDSALDFAADRFSRIIRDHGPDTVGFYISGQLLTEDYYVFNKLAKGLIGTNNIDSNSRLCMSSAVAGYKQTLGADAPPACYDDVNHAQCIFIVGSNTATAHPILFRRIEDAKAANPALKIIFCDPRRTDTAEIADLYLPILPGTDVSLFNGLLHIMLWEGWTDNAYIATHTSGFEALKALARDCTPELVAQTCGIKKEDLFEAARLFATSGATLSLYCQGLNQSSSGTAKNAALINLHLATAQIGKPGAGPFSLTGQPNAMGGREVGGMANLLSAHRDLANPAQSMPDQATVRRALERAELVIVQEAFATTATCGDADLLLPATTWGEKSGTVTNSERRISRVRPAVAAPGETRHDWSIAVDFARRLELLLPAPAFLPPPLGEGWGGGSTVNTASQPPSQPSPKGGRSNTLFHYASAESLWNEHRESTRGRDLDITGLSYALLEQAPQQWPMNAQDMARRQILEGDLVHVTSKRGSILVPVQASPGVGMSQAFMAMHWGGEYLSGLSSIGQPVAGGDPERTGVLFRAAGHEAPPPALLLELERILGLDGSYSLRYADRKKGQHRTIRLARHGDQAELTGFVLAGDTSAENWIATLLKEELPAQAYGRLLLLPGAKPPVAVQSRGHLVCNCFNISDLAIDKHLKSAGLEAGATDEARLASLQGSLKCGSNCGSCLPELKRRVRDARSVTGMTGLARTLISIKQLV